MQRFRAKVLHGLSAARCLDEGIDVPDADLAVILATSRNKRQMIQRMGRVIRRKSDGRLARLALVYVRGTSEDPRGPRQAHEAFLNEVINVADEIRYFGDSGEDVGALCAYLNDWKPKEQPVVEPAA